MSKRKQSFVPIAILLSQICGLIALSGCVCQRTTWREPTYAAPRHEPSRACDQQADAEQLYAQALSLHHRQCASCVDLLFEVATLTSQAACCDEPAARSRQLHESALQLLITAGARFRRLDPQVGLTVYRHGTEQLVPFSYQGFVWQSSDFQRLIPVGEYSAKALSRTYRCPGVGVPLVVLSCPHPGEEFRAPQSAIAATLRLNIDSSGGEQSPDGELMDWRLELYDPLRVDTVKIGCRRFPIAKDLTAPIAYRLQDQPNIGWSRFINAGAASPDSGSTTGKLYTLEPYQAGKVPVVLIHGLLADRFTWAELVNELHSQGDFIDRFQTWVFEYPTGVPFLSSAADLRQQLAQATRTFDPLGADALLSQMVLVGHSMGGLVAKLQVTSSGERLWRAVASRPLDGIAATGEDRERLRNVFFFQPSPHVARVVFIATPHRGSAFATRLVGRIGSSLVSESDQRRRRHRALINNNPNVFSKEVSRRIPTSIDLLEPHSQLLQAIESLPIQCGVATHSIIGDWCCTATLRHSDGIVPVTSARQTQVSSELFVRASHSRTKEHPDAIGELRRILDEHQQVESDLWLYDHGALNDQLLRPCRYKSKIRTPNTATGPPSMSVQ